MKRVPLSICVAAMATLGACATDEPVTPVGVVTAPAATVATAPAPAVVTSPPVAVTTQPGTVTTVPGAVVQPGAAVVVPGAAGVRPGAGRVDSSTRLTEASGIPNPLKRYGIRMDDGTVQFVDTRAPNLSIGERVELTADNHIRYPM
jgi:hypothetical protein